MGLLDYFRRRRGIAGPAHTGFATPVSPVPMPGNGAAAAGPGFTVIDVETTGLSVKHHRILEVALIRTDANGRVLGEWSRRVNPGGPVTGTEIHGITDADVAGAPSFAELVPHVNAWLAGTVVVAHNARFDLAFLRAEYAHAGWELPWAPALCTLTASSHYLPLLDRRRLSDCCAAARIPHRQAHSALGDARATAALLAYYLHPRQGVPPRREDVALLDDASTVMWPAGPSQARTAPVRSRSARRPSISDHEAQRIRIAAATARARQAVPNLVQLLEDFSLTDALDEGAPAGSLTYLEKLAEVLEDGELSAEEAADLDEIAAAHGLTSAVRTNAHRAFLLALCHLALNDGTVTRAERDELTTMAQLLALPAELVTHTLGEAEAARHARLAAELRPLPEGWRHGEPLRVGDKVAFTGCDDRQRDRLERRATELGVRVMNNVSRRTAMLITDGSFSGTKAAGAAECGTRLVHPDVFEEHLAHLQPSLLREQRPSASAPSAAHPRGHGDAITVTANLTAAVLTAAATLEAQSARGATGTVFRPVSPSVVRQWARDNGYSVGERGRIPQELFEAYHAADARS